MTIFDQTYAVFSQEFLEEFHNFRKDAMFQKICDCVGVVHIQEGDKDKLIGSWESVKKAHDVLTAYLFVKSINTPMPNSNGNPGATFMKDYGEKTERSHALLLTPSPSNHVEKETSSLAIGIGAFHKDLLQTQKEDDDEIFDLDIHYKAELERIKPQYDADGRTFYMCDVCSYAGHKRHNLIVHKIRTHIRPYKCRKCSRGFGLRKDLRRHHNNKRNCMVYGRDYKQIGESRSHLDFQLLNLEETSQQEVISSNTSENSISSSTIQENNAEPTQSAAMETDQPLNNKEGLTEESLNLKKEVDEMPEKRVFSKSLLSASVSSEKERDSGLKPNPESPSFDKIKITIGDEQNVGNSNSASSTTLKYIENPESLFEVKLEPVESTANLFEQVTGKDNTFQYNCLICNFVSSKKQQVEDHTKRVHCKQFECSFCGSMFGMRKDLNRHYRRTHKVHMNCRRRSEYEFYFDEKNN